MGVPNLALGWLPLGLGLVGGGGEDEPSELSTYIVYQWWTQDLLKGEGGITCMCKALVQNFAPCQNVEPCT